MYKLYILKRQVEDIFIYPFILVGRCIAFFNPLEREFEIFFFFPFYHTGGAEKVHALVSQATGNKNSIIYFTRKSQDQNFYQDFLNSGCTIKDISKYTDNKFLYFLNLVFRGIITGYINRQRAKPLVFNGQCNFGYKISPWIERDIPQVELIHSFNTFSWIRLPFLPFISKTIMISRVRIEDHLRQYKKLKVPAKFNSKIQFIVNGIPLPETHVKKELAGTLQILYVGRGTEEKRVHLVAEIAREAAMQKLPVRFAFMGDVKSAIVETKREYCHFYGHVSDPIEIDNVYNHSHVVIITSYTEGFPMVIEEGMARGCAVLATPVGDIPVHVKNKINGFLFSSVTDEALIVKEGIDYLTLLINNVDLLQEISARNRKYALENFSIEAFNHSYQQLFKQLRNEKF